ncbi:hypothetical protein PV04_02025 [Phialophora macrospora]|uniref:Peptidase A1 domain-containing protein n=1 Tax=Phialophora macrospora TaxID=1851006 RepID=A0A0D2G598_9EURO|nr:hypothetical protein PV04_02025 [Phialophora macrospora]
MRTSTIYTIALCLSSYAAAAPKPAPSPDEANPISSNTFGLTRNRGRSVTRPRRLRKRGSKESITTVPLEPVRLGQELTVEIGFGNAYRKAILDTGSSDTWLVMTDFQCVNRTSGQNISEEGCAFGPTVDLSSKFHQSPNEHLNISYGTGEYLFGVTGNSSFTIGNITIPEAQVSLVNRAGWVGDGITSGILGLAFPALTNIFQGTTGSQDNMTNRVPTVGVLTNMIANGLIAPLFSLAVSRDSSKTTSAGLVQLGGILHGTIPSVNSSSSSSFASVRLQKTNELQTSPDPVLEFYTIGLDSITLSANTTLKSPGQYIVDSGTALNLITIDAADAINHAYDPPATIHFPDGNYIVNCTATPPKVALDIGGQQFEINAKDMVVPDDGLPEGVCLAGFQAGGDGSEEQGLLTLGDVFLRNVLAVFDIGAETIEFASRVYYES